VEEDVMPELGPDEIRAKDFRRVRRGVDPKEVAEFLDRVAGEVEGLRGQLDEMRGLVAEANERMTDVLAAEEALQRTILTATKARDEMLGRAEREARQILAEAQVEAARIFESARRHRTGATVKVDEGMEIIT